MMVYTTQKYGGSELCPSSGILKSRKHNILETGSVSVPRWRNTPTLLDPLERANLNYWCYSSIQFMLHSF
jgi:hypothetical protein